MNIAIIGGTSHVSTELCAIFREWGHDVRPSARSRVSASFLNDQEFDPVIGDITERDTMQRVVNGADAIVIAAFARQYSKGFSPKEAHKTNKTIVENAVIEAPDDASLFYFSTIAIYSEETGISRFDSYTREKKRVERAFLNACDDHKKDGFIFRMGPVYGPNQTNTSQLRNKVARKTIDGELHVNVEAERSSNLVHTVTVADSITTAHTTAIDGDTFTVVNHPQWTWGDVFEHYTPTDTELVFYTRDDGENGGIARKFLSTGSEFLEANERSLRSLSVYLPDRVNNRVFHEYVKRKTRSGLANFDENARVKIGQFEQKSVPGHRIPGLSKTKQLLAGDQEWSDIFQTEQNINTRSSGSIVQF